MATTWSAYSNHIRVGINLTWSDSTPAPGQTVTVSATYYLESNQNYSDNETFNYSFNGANYSTTVSLPSNSTLTVATRTMTFTAQSGHSRTISASCTGHDYTGAAPTVSTATPSIVTTSTASAPTWGGGLTWWTGTYTTLRFNWNSATAHGDPVTGYRVQLYTGAAPDTNSPSSTGTLYTTVTTTSLTYTFTGLTPGTQYWVRAQAMSATQGPSDWSSGSVSGTTTAAVAPGVPSSVAAVDNTVVTSGLAVPGIKITGVAGALNGQTTQWFDFYFSTSSTPPTTSTTPTHHGQTSPSYTSVSGDSIAAATTYYCWMRANSVNTGVYSSSGTSAWSGTGSAGSGASVTTQATGSQGDLVDRIDAFAKQAGADVGKLARRGQFASFSTTSGTPLTAGTATNVANWSSTGETGDQGSAVATVSGATFTIVNAGYYELDAMIYFNGVPANNYYGVYLTNRYNRPSNGATTLAAYCPCYQGPTYFAAGATFTVRGICQSAMSTTVAYLKIIRRA